MSDVISLDLSEDQFARIAGMVYDVCRINLHSGKEMLVRGRLARRLRALGLESFDEYIRFIELYENREEIEAMIDALTTNETSFFRESGHLQFMREQVLPSLVGNLRPMRVWSAGCSSGEEPYSIAMTLCESAPNMDLADVRILATDISSTVISLARSGVYDEDAIAGVPPDLRSRYFSVRRGPSGTEYLVGNRLRKITRFARLNLMDEWPMKGPFDMIFCRNVMIYFDKPTQLDLVERFRRILTPHGYLMVGHSESLAGADHLFRYVQPAVYERLPDYDSR